MPDPKSNNELLEQYKRARSFFLRGMFALAEKEILKYRNSINYRTLPFEDRRSNEQSDLSLIVVSYDQNNALIDCLDSLSHPNSVKTEILLIDNGKNQRIHSELKKREIFHFFSPINFAPSESRNIAAYFAKGAILVFIDDDSIAEPGFIDSVHTAFKSFSFLAIRGRILDKSVGGNSAAPRHYDLGEYPIPATLATEGNMAVAREAYDAVGGMHPLMFGMEGIEFTWRLSNRYPERDIYYWPGMTIRHDHVYWNGRSAKKQRHAVAKQYLKRVMGKSSNLSAQYAQWYDDRPGPFKRYECRSFATRVRHAAFEAIVALVYGRRKIQHH